LEEGEKVSRSTLSTVIRNIVNIDPGIILIVTIIPLAVILTLLYTGDKSLWLDESISVAIARLDWPTMWQVVSQGEANMGLYYILLHFWLNLGESEFVIRSLSAIFAVLTVPIIYTLGSRLFNKYIGLIAALVVVVNTFFIRYAQEARSYSLVLFLISLSSLLFVMAIQRSSKRFWTAYVIVSALAVYAHVFAVFALIAQVLSLVLLRRQEIPWKALLIIGVSIIILITPLAYSILTNSTHNLDHQTVPNISEIIDVFFRFTESGPLTAVYLLMGIVALIYAIKQWLVTRFSYETWRYALLLSWLFIPVVIVFCISQFKPMFSSLYLIVCLSPLVLLVGIGVYRLPRRWLLAIVLVAILGISGAELHSWYIDFEKEDWRGATTYIISEAHEQDAIIFYSPDVGTGFDYYWSRTPHNLILTPVPYFNPMEYKAINPVFDIPIGYVPGGNLPEPDGNLPFRLEKYERVWLVLSHDYIVNENMDRLSQSQMIQGLLQGKYGIPEEKDFKAIRVLLFSSS
jgi:mannosyltransferase